MPKVFAMCIIKSSAAKILISHSWPYIKGYAVEILLCTKCTDRSKKIRSNNYTLSRHVHGIKNNVSGIKS